MGLRLVLRGFAAAILLLLALEAATLGYPPPAGQIIFSGPSMVVACEKVADVTVRVVRSDTGDPIAGVGLTWTLTLTQAAGDYLTPTHTVTDANGYSTVQIHFAPVPGPRQISVTADAGSGVGPSTLTVRCAAGGLPPTSTGPMVPFGLGYILAAGAVALGFGIMVFRFVRR
jgi:hypothetical protein